MKIIEHTADIPYAPIPNQRTLILDDALPPRDLITSIFALAFDQDKLLHAKYKDGRWHPPGGHIEPSETLLQALHREVYEETYAKLGTVGFLGYEKIVVLAEKPEDYRYPYPESYQAIYWGKIASLDPFSPTNETLGRGFVTPAEMRRNKGLNLKLFETALAKATQ